MIANGLQGIRSEVDAARVKPFQTSKMTNKKDLFVGEILALKENKFEQERYN